MSAPTSRQDPQKLSPVDASRLLSRIGGKRVEDSALAADVATGAPTKEGLL